MEMPAPPTAGGETQPRAQRLLRYGALLYLVGFLAHTGDHLRRGIDVVTSHVLWAGNVSAVLAVVAITLVLLRHRFGPLAAIAVGLPAAVGVAAVHLLPQWSTALSDSLPDGNVDGLTWAAVLIEIGGAFAFGLAGLYALRRAPVLWHAQRCP
jgi:hypothetical protein